MQLPDSKAIEEMNKLGFYRKSSEGKGDRIMDRLNNSFNNHKYKKNNKTKKFKGKFCFDNDLFIDIYRKYFYK